MEKPVSSVRKSLAQTPGRWLPETGADLKPLILKWSSEIRDWKIRWESGIYPGEMAAFLGLCDLCGVRSIIESGRGEHAYSTQILGEFAQRTGVRVISIDFSAIDGRPFEDRIRRYENLQCIAGNTFNVFPSAAYVISGPIALLLDGPKLGPANRLSFAVSRMFEVVVVAHHNSRLDTPWGREFAEIFPGAFHYEHLGLSAMAEWRDFKDWERSWVRSYELEDLPDGTPGRSLNISSLAMAVISSRDVWKKLLRLLGGHPRYSPLWLWMRWSVPRLIRLMRPP